MQAASAPHRMLSAVGRWWYRNNNDIKVLALVFIGLAIDYVAHRQFFWGFYLAVLGFTIVSLYYSNRQLRAAIKLKDEALEHADLMLRRLSPEYRDLSDRERANRAQ